MEKKTHRDRVLTHSLSRSVIILYYYCTRWKKKGDRRRIVNVVHECGNRNESPIVARLSNVQSTKAVFLGVAAALTSVTLQSAGLPLQNDQKIFFSLPIQLKEKIFFQFFQCEMISKFSQSFLLRKFPMAGNSLNFLECTRTSQKMFHLIYPKYT